MSLCAGAAAAAGLARDISFSLRDAQGPVTEKSYPGKYLLLTIGYTTCPDICPTTLYEYGQAMQAIDNPDAIQPIFVTIDPVNDDAARLAEYTGHFDKRIAGLTGEMKDIEALAQQLGATFGYRQDGKKISQPQKGMRYSVYHSALIYLIGPDRKLLDVYDYQIGAEGLTEALNKVLGPAPKATPPSNPKAAPQASPQASASPFIKTAAAAQPAASACPLPPGFAPVAQPLALKDVLAQPPADKVTLLNVWALWCAPCRVELPLLDQLAASQKQLRVHTLNLGDKAPDIAALFAKMNLQHLPQTSSADKGLLKRLGARGLPYTALFVDGVQVATKGGIIDDTDALSAYAQCMSRGQGLI
ncbi:MAG: SCO family protein [Pseudomonadota bacterium]|nr:SCO family protein [Pseudomonadota bacterium]